MTQADAVSDFLVLWRDPAQGKSITVERWDGIVRVARAAKLLAALQHRLETSGSWSAIPEPVASVLTGERYRADFIAQMVRSVVCRLDQILEPVHMPVVLLKGAAYLMQSLPHVPGRLVADVDILVPAAALEEVERRLLAAGWEFPQLDAYDDRYYRAWSHELPPLRYPDQPLELDVHHQILPPTGRIHPDADALFAASVPIPGTALRALDPADQVLHAAAHAFQDSDCVNRIRDVADMDALLRLHGTQPGFDRELLQRASLHGMERPLAYAIAQARHFFGTPVSSDVQARLQTGRLRERTMNRLLSFVLRPASPDSLPGPGLRAARFALLCRYHAMRMPLGLLIRHSASKAFRGWQQDRQAKKASQLTVAAQ